MKWYFAPGVRMPCKDWYIKGWWVKYIDMQAFDELAAMLRGEE